MWVAFGLKYLTIVVAPFFTSSVIFAYRISQNNKIHGSIVQNQIYSSTIWGFWTEKEPKFGRISGSKRSFLVVPSVTIFIAISLRKW